MFKYIKCRNVKSPNRGTKQSAGIDFYIPDDFETKSIGFGQDIKIPSGIKCIIPEGCVMIFQDKSGVALNKGLSVGAKVIDSDYRGEINIHLTRIKFGDITLTAGDKIIQGIITKIDLNNPLHITEAEYNAQADTERGEGGFGSTGTK